MTIMKKTIFVLMLALTVGLAGCSSKIEGTFEADVSSIKNPNIAKIMAMVKPQLVFDDKGASMKVNFFGQEKVHQLQAEFSGKQVTLSKEGDKEKIVLKLTDSNTLSCVKCPKDSPARWIRKK